MFSSHVFLGSLEPMILLAFLRLDVNIFEAIMLNDLVGMACLVWLGYMSVWSGALIVTKMRQILAASRETDAFMADCFEGQKSLPEIYELASQYPNSPLANLLSEAYIQYEIELEQFGKDGLSVEQQIQFSQNSVECVMERTMSSELRRLDDRLISLATASTLGPFLGLFGTVWGVLASFQAIGREGAGDLSALAPGISTALVTTVFGLVVAIPAVWAYNFLAANVSRLSSQMESFAYELSTIFQKHLIRRS
ncbi:MAG: MotA/TolQ/ExbB proton channel family protein [Candidatus Sumerlaeia bacterium]|nr:MotA/TolQ/ExbB proton channel family protein [Candidatus Sumerlaeia bacterium]